MPRRDFSKVAFAATGDTNVIPTPTQPDGSISLQTGWGFDYQRDNGAGGGTPDPLAKNIDREDMNGILNEITASIGEMQQNGFPIWVSTAAPYPINAHVRDSDKIWKSQVVNNSSTPGTNSDWLDVTSVAPLLLLADASAGPLTLTLPLANAATGPVERIYRRTDITSNAVVIQASGTDRIMLDTSGSAAGSTQTELIFGGDYLRLRSDGAGKWWCVGQAPLPASVSSGLVKYETAGVFSYTVPAVLRSGRKKATVRAIGGGGGGGGVQCTVSAASGGGGGGGGAEDLIDLTGLTTVTVTVGAGGNGGQLSNGWTGLNGGATSIGSFVSASGGLGGAGAGSLSVATVLSGASGGVGTVGSIRARGNGGSDGSLVSITSSGGALGGNSGGGAFIGGGVDGGLGAGVSGSTPGEGGSGVGITNSAFSGGNGAPGGAYFKW